MRKRPDPSASAVPLSTSTNVRRPLLPTLDPNTPHNPPHPPTSTPNALTSPQKLTYQQLKERGFTGTRYDAELVQHHGLYEATSEPPTPPTAVTPPPPSLPVEVSPPEDDPPGLNVFSLKPPTPKGIRVHQRSLRCTPDRIRKRCQLGRAASDSSSGISDDGSTSSHSSSGSDSGIETASLEDGLHLEQGLYWYRWRQYYEIKVLYNIEVK